MQPINFDEILDKIVEKNPQYHLEAYLFLREGLDFAQKKIGKSNKHEIRHITGKELLAGLREYGISAYGPMTVTVLEEWGVTRCEDFGEMVFQMVEHGLLSKTERDSREDFKDGYLFDDAFRKPFLPSGKAKLVESRSTQPKTS
ncbi:MAG: hypothetical protein O2960_19735 [Verrucomicrobia bacterium]|nr:hypothetical protein [Verrucomicrobiota bacterium]